jgi:UDPglucose--hexose-1-phosphate uridylyltransferase
VSVRRLADGAAGGPEGAVRVDPLSGAHVHVVSGRQDRPIRPADGCPFCVGGLEAPEPYDVRWFPNRWPAMAADRCEVVLYAPKHGAALWSLGVDGARRVVDVWAARTAALGARPDVGYVLVFENRGAAVGATIDHPHGQIYAFGEVPPVPAAEAERAGADDPLASPADPATVVATAPGWRAWVPASATHPLEVVLAPDQPLPDLPAASAAAREGLAALLVDVLERCDHLYDEPLPYMLWIHQRPPRAAMWPVRLHVHLVSPMRAADTWRYVAAGELGSGVFFNPVDPLEAAERLRSALSPSRSLEA